MAAPTIGRRRGWAPKNGAVDWSHPLASGLKSLVLPGALVDLVGVKAVTATGNPAFASTPYGPGIKLDGVDDYVDIGQPIKTAGAWTLMAVARITAALSGSACFIGERYAPSNTNAAYTMSQDISGGGGNPQAGYFNGGWRLVTGTALTVGRWYNLVATFAGNAGALNFYYDGLQVGSGSGGGTDPTPDENTFIGRGHNAGNPAFPGDVAVTGVWNRELTANDVAALAADPFTMLRY